MENPRICQSREKYINIASIIWVRDCNYYLCDYCAVLLNSFFFLFFTPREFKLLPIRINEYYVYLKVVKA